MTRADAQPVLAGVTAALVGFAGSLTIVLAGLHAVGADRAQASSGLLVTASQITALGLSAPFWGCSPGWACSAWSGWGGKGG
jgi:predicted benzoate:H+ symporter BenE